MARQYRSGVFMATDAEQVVDSAVIAAHEFRDPEAFLRLVALRVNEEGDRLTLSDNPESVSCDKMPEKPGS